MVRIHFTFGVANFDIDFQMRIKTSQLFVKIVFKNFNFLGLGNQKNQSPKIYFWS